MSLGFLPTPIALAQTVQPIEYSIETAPLILEAYAVKHGINSKEFIAVARCESGFNPKAFNPKDPNGGSKGVFQFQPKTFAYYSKEAGIENANVWNYEDNIETAGYMFSKGLQGHWSCWKKVAPDNVKRV